jgi:hypothetical protein
MHADDIWAVLIACCHLQCPFLPALISRAVCVPNVSLHLNEVLALW